MADKATQLLGQTASESKNINQLTDRLLECLALLFDELAAEASLHNEFVDRSLANVKHASDKLKLALLKRQL